MTTDNANAATTARKRLRTKRTTEPADTATDQHDQADEHPDGWSLTWQVNDLGGLVTNVDDHPDMPALNTARERYGREVRNIDAQRDELKARREELRAQCVEAFKTGAPAEELLAELVDTAIAVSRLDVLADELRPIGNEIGRTRTVLRAWASQRARAEMRRQRREAEAAGVKVLNHWSPEPAKRDEFVRPSLGGRR